MRWTLLGLGVALLLISLAGRSRTVGGYQNLAPRAWERFDPALDREVSSVDGLFAEAQRRSGQPLESMSPADAMAVLYQVTAARVTHGHLAEYNFFSNWILWSASLVYPPAAEIQDPDKMLRYGHSVLCSQAAELLAVLAQRLSFPVRLVNVTGHVVMEAWYQGGWHMYDPDLEAVAVHGGPPTDVRNGSVLSVDEVGSEHGLTAALYQNRADPTLPSFLATAFENRDDNISIEFLTPARHAWEGPTLSPRRYDLELASGVLEYLLPLALIALGLTRVKEQASQREDLVGLEPVHAF